MKKVRIIGGGITGLTCAYRLARAGHDVEIYEKGEELGGLMALLLATISFTIMAHMSFARRTLYSFQR